jgi:excisionase family DNA binding protein
MLTVKEAATQLGMSARFVYRLCANGILDHWKLGGRIRIATEAISAYLDGQRKGVTQEVTPRKVSLSCLKLR